MEQDKSMTGEQRELLRNAMLMQLADARPLGLRKNFLLMGCKTMAGFPMLTEREHDKHLRYLVAHGMIELDERDMNKGVEIYRITTEGIEWLDNEGLI